MLVQWIQMSRLLLKYSISCFWNPEFGQTSFDALLLWANFLASSNVIFFLLMMYKMIMVPALDCPALQLTKTRPFPSRASSRNLSDWSKYGDKSSVGISSTGILRYWNLPWKLFSYEDRLTMWVIPRLSSRSKSFAGTNPPEFGRRCYG